MSAGGCRATFWMIVCEAAALQPPAAGFLKHPEWHRQSPVKDPRNSESGSYKGVLVVGALKTLVWHCPVFFGQADCFAALTC